MLTVGPLKADFQEESRVKTDGQCITTSSQGQDYNLLMDTAVNSAFTSATVDYITSMLQHPG